MNEKLLKLCGDKIEVLYQPRRRIPAEAAWQRLREELSLISGTEAEQRFLTAAEIAKICRRNSWPVWTVGSGPSSVILFLLELSQADPLEHGLLFERFFYPSAGRIAELTFTTLDKCVEPLKKLLAQSDATAWITVNTASVPEAIPLLVEQELRRQGKAPDWGREPTDWPIIWEIFDSRSADRFCEPDVYQFHLVDVFEARQAWQPGSPVQLAAITAITSEAAIEEIDPFTWAQREESSAELLEPWTKEFGGVLVFEEQVMAVLHEIGGFDLPTAWRVVGDLAKKKASAIDQFEKQFLQAAVDSGHEYGRAWSACDEIRHAGMRGLACKAHHVAHAVTTFRALWLKIHHNRVYKLYAPPEVNSHQVE